MYLLFLSAKRKRSASLQQRGVQSAPVLLSWLSLKLLAATSADLLITKKEKLYVKHIN